MPSKKAEANKMEVTFHNRDLAQKVKEEILECLNKKVSGSKLKRFEQATFMISLNKKTIVQQRVTDSTNTGVIRRYRREMGPGITSCQYWEFEQLVKREYQQSGGLSRRGEPLGLPEGEEPLVLEVLDVNGHQGFEEEMVEPAEAVGLPSG